MTAVTTSITVLSCSLFVCALIKMLAPVGNTEKILRLVISVFVLICVVTCFKSLGGALNVKDFKNHISVNTNEAVLKTTGDYMAEYIDNLLLSEDITGHTVKVTVEADENSVINLSEVSIYIDKSLIIHKSKITEIVERDLNITPQVKVKEQ